ncbi:hypothetical protein WN51_13339 [Melipona quadrifasciata]|uniref:PiggyBac transposable element-derived protein 4 C-terminal zinc-finger domain-containing protein n=1 Tax=Melipona quadrifasciata TaxID=166423 RepID=A0A0M9A2C4_9HYME|nr:hypothetical protein WN51_13339 [Melipona quadrifasciata]
MKTHLERITRSGEKNIHRNVVVCKVHGKHTDTSFICKFCRVPLCKGHCFTIYHTKQKY